MSAATEPVPTTAAPRSVMPVLFVGVFMAALDTAVIGPAIPVLRESFAVDNRQIGLVMSVFILFSLCSNAFMSNLSDRHGQRPVYLTCVAIFAVGSAMIALAPAFWVVLLGRAVQGVGAGGITPIASAVIGSAVPPDQRGRALGLIGATFGMAFVLGAPLAGLIMLVASWHWIFFINLPIAVVVLWLGAKSLPAPNRDAATHPPLDVAGMVLTFAVLSALVLGITRIADVLTGEQLWPWLLTAAAVLLALLIAVELRAVRPMVPVTLFRNRQLALTYLLAAGAGFGMGAVVFLSSIATLAHGVAPKYVGFALLPMVLASMAGSMGGGRLLNRLGARAIIACGFALLVAGYAASSVTNSGLVAFLVASIPVGLGVGIVVGGSLRTIALDEAPLSSRAVAQGLINVSTSIGTLLSAAVISALADQQGGGAAGFGFAYQCVAAAMAAMLLLTFALHRHAPRH